MFLGPLPCPPPHTHAHKSQPPPTCVARVTSHLEFPFRLLTPPFLPPPPPLKSHKSQCPPPHTHTCVTRVRKAFFSSPSYSLRGWKGRRARYTKLDMPYSSLSGFTGADSSRASCACLLPGLKVCPAVAAVLGGLLPGLEAGSWSVSVAAVLPGFVSEDLEAAGSWSKSLSVWAAGLLASLPSAGERSRASQPGA